MADFEKGKNRDQSRSVGLDSNNDAVNKILVSFYVTNLSSYLQPIELWKQCEKIETVVDVYIALKRSRLGRRFGFVRFIEVKNNQELEKKLCEIWFGNYHVFSSLSKYKRLCFKSQKKCLARKKK